MMGLRKGVRYEYDYQHYTVTRSYDHVLFLFISIVPSGVRVMCEKLEF